MKKKTLSAVARAAAIGALDLARVTRVDFE